MTSPGGLYNGLTYEEIMNGHSKLRNRVIANVFSQMGLVESWGTGIRRIMEAAKDYHLPVPEFQIFDEMVRVNLFRDLSQTTNQKNYSCISKNYRKRVGEASGKYQRNIGEASEKHRRNIGENLNDTQRKILVLLSEDEQLSAAKMAKRIGISSRNIESNIKKLRERGILIRHGSPKSGYWEINAGFGYDWEGKK